MSRPNFRTWQQRRFLLALVLSLSMATVPFIPSSRATSVSVSPQDKASLAGQTPAATRSESTAEATERAQEAYGKLSLQFEANQGQTDRQVNFITHANGATVFLTSTKAVFVLRDSHCGVGNQAATHTPAKLDNRHSENNPQPTVCNPQAVALSMTIEGANSAPQVEGLDKLPGIVNYFIGNDAAKWHTDIPTFGRVHYESVYEGVDLVYYGNQRQLEYDFVVKPGADASRIALNFEGANALALDAGGDLLIETSVGTIRQQKPLVYQEVNGERKEIESAYLLKGAGSVGFEVRAYDAERPLIIDPVLVYSTYLGGSGEDSGHAIAVDAAGNAYVIGQTFSANFPTTGAFQASNGGGDDAFVTKLNAAGTTPVYSTYFGGSGDDEARGIAVDSAGNAYLTGGTKSVNFPTTPGAFATTKSNPDGGDVDGFVTKLNAAGTALYSTYLGGSGDDVGRGIAVDSAGNASVTGETNSTTTFPTANAYQGTNGGGTCNGLPCSDAFVTKLNASGSSLTYSTYIGGSGSDFGRGIALDSAGNAYVTGDTDSTNFPTANPLQTANESGFSDAFVTKLNAAGSALVYSTYLSGSNFDFGNGIAVDAAGNAYVTGQTFSANFPAVNAYQGTKGGAGTTDAFVTKFNAAGSALVYSTYLGGSGNDKGSGIAVDAAGNAYVTGRTGGPGFPTANPIQTAYGGNFDAFVTKLNAVGSALLYSTYLGGSDEDLGLGIAVDAAGNAYITGVTNSTNFPTTPEAFQPGKDAGGSIFISKIGSYLVAGRVVDPGGNPIAGVTVTLSGSSSATATTDAAGNFLFLRTTPGGEFNVTPFKAGFTFSPPSTYIFDLDSNRDLPPTPTPTPTPAQTSVHFEFDQYIAVEDCGGLSVAVVRSGDTTGALTVDFATADGTAKQKGDYGITLGTISFASGDTRKVLSLPITEDAFSEGDETFSVNLFNLIGPAILEEPSRATVIIADNDPSGNAVNPIDDTHNFVVQHYHDFFNREPDTSGLLFWTNNIDSCGANALCREAKRIDTSAAFFLSIEFQGTGFYAIRLQRTAFGKRSDSASTRMTYQDLVRNTRQLGEGVIVGEAGADAKLEQNKQNYAQQVVDSAAFIAHFPTTLTAAEYVDALYASAQITPTATERTDAITAFGGGGTSGRVAALRKIAESQSLINAEFSPAFVLLQYHGYLRRNPTDLPDLNDSGYQFWLTKLNSFGGDFRKAEMVKAFLSSAEYRQRFGQP